MIYCTLLHPAIDVIYSMKELSGGKTYCGTEALCEPAGKAVNVAKAIASLGEEVCVIGVMPRDNHDQFSNYLSKKNIQSDFFEVSGSVRINATIIESDPSQVTHINAQSNALPSALSGEIADFLSSRMKAGDSWALCGSLPAGIDKGFYKDCIAACKTAGCHTVLDTSEQAFKVGVVAKPDMIKPNLVELEGYFGESVKGVRHIALKGKRFIDMGIPQVFISLGSDGMIAIAGSECLLCTAPPVRVVDTVGCGDALVAGLLVGKLRALSFADTCRLAVACGSSNAMHRGPGHIDRSEVVSLMEQVFVEAV